MEKSAFTREYEVMLRLLRQYRNSKDVSQVELARRLGETQSFISKCERGERRLDLVQLRAFCNAIGVKLGDFVAEFEKQITRRKN